MARMLFREHGYASCTIMYGGPYISHVASRLCVLTPEATTRVSNLAFGFTTLGRRVIISMGLLRMFGNEYRLVDSEGDIWVKPVVVDDLDEEIEQVFWEIVGDGQEEPVQDQHAPE
jgi:hypothetical protein